MSADSVGADAKRVAVVGDSPLLRRGLAGVIESAPDLVLTVSVQSVAEAEGVLEAGDVVLLDLQLQPSLLSAAIGRLAGHGAEVLVLCSGPRDDVAQAMRAGARGCLSRQAGEAELLVAISLAASGCAYVSAVLALPPDDEGAGRLTDRERQILELVAGGETDHGIAERLGISEHTVHSHLDRLRDKVGSRRRVDLTRFALMHAIVPNPPPGERPDG
ncbi:response regulator transcription factor [Kitasatospora sp. NPDC047058]|uniref:response regulator transcription factor n=1 Tax=Kitasatospora sp. NPDC047058 TaxID=3155620 RepID=UPI00340B41C5